jgi:hypothetical protein
VARQILIILIVVVTFGILVPWYKGFALLDPRILSAYACLALLFVAPASAELSAVQQTEISPARLLAKIGILVGYGWALTLVIVVTALVTLNVTHWRGTLITPPWGLGAALLVFSLAGSAAVAVLGAVLARRFSASGAKSILRGLFLLVLLALVSSSRVLPDSWQIVLSDHSTRRAITRLAWQGSGAALVIACLLWIPLLKKPSNVEA